MIVNDPLLGFTSIVWTFVTVPSSIYARHGVVVSFVHDRTETYGNNRTEKAEEKGSAAVHCWLCPHLRSGRGNKRTNERTNRRWLTHEEPGTRKTGESVFSCRIKDNPVPKAKLARASGSCVFRRRCTPCDCLKTRSISRYFYAFSLATLSSFHSIKFRRLTHGPDVRWQLDENHPRKSVDSVENCQPRA